MYEKVDIYNLTLAHLLLIKRTSDPDADNSKEIQVLNSVYQAAFLKTLEELDLDSTSTQMNMELVAEDPNDLWSFAYKYPSKCVRFRRLQSPVVRDTRDTQIPKNIRIYNGTKCIFTDEDSAIAEFISSDTKLSALSASAGLALSYKLAILSAPLIAPKIAIKLMSELNKFYLVAKEEARLLDHEESHTFETDEEMSEFVRERTS